MADMVYMAYFTISTLLCYKSNKEIPKRFAKLCLNVLLILGGLQYISVVPNFWQGDDVFTDYATGMYSEPSFFALSLYWLILLSQDRLVKVLIYGVIVFALTRSYTVLFLLLAYSILPMKFYKFSPLLVLLYLFFVINSSFSLGTLTLLFMGSWRETATESLLVENLFNIGGSIQDAVWSGQNVISGSHLDWIDTSYSLISILSMWSTYFALLVYAVFINKARTKKDLHLVFMGFFIVPKWMIFYLLLNTSNGTGIRSKKARTT